MLLTRLTMSPNRAPIHESDPRQHVIIYVDFAVAQVSPLPESADCRKHGRVGGRSALIMRPSRHKSRLQWRSAERRQAVHDRYEIFRERRIARQLLADQR